MSDILSTIDAALSNATGDPAVSGDAMRWTPAVSDRPGMTFPALLVPADPFEPVRLIDLGADSYEGARTAIGCNLIEKVTVESAGPVSVDFLFDEEGSPRIRSDAELNERATHLGYALKLAQMNGQYPGPRGLGSRDLAEQATAWRRYIHLHGPVVIVGADERMGEWVPVPAPLVEFAVDALDLDAS